jgi:hypothetical protein
MLFMNSGGKSHRKCLASLSNILQNWKTES